MDVDFVTFKQGIEVAFTFCCTSIVISLCNNLIAEFVFS